MVRYNEVKTGNQKSGFKVVFRTISLYDIMFLSLGHDVSWFPFILCKNFFGTYGFVALVCGSYMCCCFVCSPLEVRSSICIYKLFLHPSFGYHNRYSLMFKPSMDP
jgi:hypothetical protein